VKWADAESGGRHQISTSSFGRGEAIRVKRIRDIVTLYRSGVDGAFGVRLAVAPDGRASDRELRWAVVTSEPYLLVVSGGLVCISGLEWVGSPESAPIRATLPHGRYAVRCTLVAWDEEAAAHGLDGPPGEDALPDFLVVVEPAEAEVGFRTDTATFDPPDV
jgi:hypothetical protein